MDAPWSVSLAQQANSTPSNSSIRFTGRRNWRLFKDFSKESKRPSKPGRFQLQTEIRRLTQALADNPHDCSLWLERGQALVQLPLPELAASDAHKALLILEQAKKEHGLEDFTPREIKGQTLLATALFLTGSFIECLDILDHLRDNYLDWYTNTELCRLDSFNERGYAEAWATHAIARGTTSEPENLRDFKNEFREKLGIVEDVTYPWMRPELFPLQQDQIDRVTGDALKRMEIAVELRLPRRTWGQRQVHVGGGWLNVVAKQGLERGHRISASSSFFCGADSSARCVGCCTLFIQRGDPVQGVDGQYCNATCLESVAKNCGSGAVLRPDHPATREDKLLRRVFGFANKAIACHPGLHPLQLTLFSTLASGADDPGLHPFSYQRDVVRANNHLQACGIDIFGSPAWDGWVVQTILRRVKMATMVLGHGDDKICALFPGNSLFSAKHKVERSDPRPTLGMRTFLFGTGKANVIEYYAEKDIAPGDRLSLDGGRGY